MEVHNTIMGVFEYPYLLQIMWIFPPILCKYCLTYLKSKISKNDEDATKIDMHGIV